MKIVRFSSCSGMQDAVVPSLGLSFNNGEQQTLSDDVANELLSTGCKKCWSLVQPEAPKASKSSGSSDSAAVKE